MKREKGITLISLVVTIIILVILAGVSISLVLGDNGIVTKAKLGKQNMEKAQGEENNSLLELVNEMDYHIASSSREYFTETELWAWSSTTAGNEMQLNDSWENYKSLVFSLANGICYADREILVSTIKYWKEVNNNQTLALHWADSTYATIAFPEDTTKITAISGANNTGIYRVIGLK